MTPKHKALLVRLTLLATFGGVCFVLLSPLIYRPRTRTFASVALSDVGVTIQGGDKPGTIYVKVDDREETIPQGQEDSSALYHEAIQRISSNAKAHLGEKYIDFSWFRLIRWWLPPMVFAYWLLFRVWQPRRDYIEGQ